MKFSLTQDGFEGLMNGSIVVTDGLLWCDSIELERDGDDFKMKFLYKEKIVCEIDKSITINDGWSVRIASDIKYPIKINFEAGITL